MQLCSILHWYLVHCYSLNIYCAYLIAFWIGNQNTKTINIYTVMVHFMGLCVSVHEFCEVIVTGRIFSYWVCFSYLWNKVSIHVLVFHFSRAFYKIISIIANNIFCNVTQCIITIFIIIISFPDTVLLIP